MIWAANYSLGVNLLLNLVERAAAALPADFDIDILEMHHRQKVDAPSGTALVLGKAAAKGRGVDFDAVKMPEPRGPDRRSGPAAKSALPRCGAAPSPVTIRSCLPVRMNGSRSDIARQTGASLPLARCRQLRGWRAGSRALYTMNDVLGLTD